MGEQGFGFGLLVVASCTGFATLSAWRTGSAIRDLWLMGCFGAVALCAGIGVALWGH